MAVFCRSSKQVRWCVKKKKPGRISLNFFPTLTRVHSKHKLFLMKVRCVLMQVPAICNYFMATTRLWICLHRSRHFTSFTCIFCILRSGAFITSSEDHKTSVRCRRFGVCLRTKGYPTNLWSPPNSDFRYTPGRGHIQVGKCGAYRRMPSDAAYNQWLVRAESIFFIWHRQVCRE